VKRNFSPPLWSATLSGTYGTGFTREQLERYVKTVKIVGTEGCLQNATNLFVVAGCLELFPGSPDCEVVDDDQALFEGALSHAAEFAQFEIAQALHANPNADSQYRENQSQGASRRPKQKQAKQGEHGGDRIQHNHDLAMSEAVLQQLVMDVLTVGGKHGVPADQAPEDGERRFQDRQAEGNNRNGNRDNGRGLLRSGESKGA